MFNTIQFLAVVPDSSSLYVAYYKSEWIWVSVLLAILMSYAALNAATRANGAISKESQVIWILISALALGVGSWAMHFVGMLALRLPCSISYGPNMTLISMIPSLLAAHVVFGFVWHHQLKKPSPIIGGILLGSGIGTMHYMGMAAMQIEGIVRYDPILFVISIIVAIVLSYLALCVKNSRHSLKRYGNALVAVILGGAVSGMHYTAMAATYFVKGDAAALPATVFTPDSLAVIVSLATVFLAFVALALTALSHAREVTAELSLGKQLFQSMIDSIPDAIFLKDSDSRWLATNEAAKQLFRLNEIAWQGKTEMELANSQPEFRIGHEGCLLDDTAAWSAGKLTLFEYSMTDEHGDKTYLEVRKNPSFNAMGQAKNLLVIARDITEKKIIEEKLRVAATVFESQEGMMVTNANRIILRVNHSFTKITGYSAEDVIGKTPSFLNSGRQDEAFYATMWERIYNTGAWEGEVWNRHKNGDVYPEQLTITAVKAASGAITNYVATFTDITQSKAAAEAIKTLAFYDPLTRIPNRRMLIDRLNQAMTASKRNNSYGALIFLDLDNFKPLNDTHGHVVGDMLLIEAAQRLKNCTREMDTVARFGGDEFVVMLAKLDEDKAMSITQAGIVAEKIRATLSTPYRFNISHDAQADMIVEHRCTASLGVAMFIGRDSNQDDVMRWADAAMYEAKDADRNQIRFHGAKKRFVGNSF